MSNVAATVRAAVRDAAGPQRRILRLRELGAAGGGPVVEVRLDGEGPRLVVKLTPPDGVSGPVFSPERTAGAVTAARAAGVPAPEVLAAADPGADGEPGVLVLRRARVVADEHQRARFGALLDRETVDLGAERPTLCHDDLHHGNVVLAQERRRWRLAGLLDWDKAWAGPPESDVARLAFWDDMTGPGFWEVYRAAVPEDDGEPQRAAVHQLLWCLEHAAPTERHRADTAALWALLEDGAS